MAKECDQPRNPDMVVCRNCEKMGHFSRDCPEPKNWEKHKCSNCGEMGHGPKVSALHAVKENQANINSDARHQLSRTAAITVVATMAMVGETQEVLLVSTMLLVLPGTLALVSLHGTPVVVQRGKGLFTMDHSDVLF